MKEYEQHNMLKDLFESEQYFSQFQPSEREIRDFFSRLNDESDLSLISKFESIDYTKQFEPTEQDWLFFQKCYLNKTFVYKQLFVDAITLTLLLLAYSLNINFKMNNYKTSENKMITRTAPNLSYPYTDSIAISHKYIFATDSQKSANSHTQKNNFSQKEIISFSVDSHSFLGIDVNQIYNSRKLTQSYTTKSHSKQNENNSSYRQSFVQHAAITNQSLKSQKSFTTITHTISINTHTISNNSKSDTLCLKEKSELISTKPLPLLSSFIYTEPTVSLLNILPVNKVSNKSKLNIIQLKSSALYNFGYTKNAGKGFSPFIEVSYLSNILHKNIFFEVGANYLAHYNLNASIITDIRTQYDFGFIKDTIFIHYKNFHFISIPIKLHYVSLFGDFSAGMLLHYLTYTNSSILTHHYENNHIVQTSIKADNYITGLNNFNYSFALQYQYYFYKRWFVYLLYYQNMLSIQKESFTFNNLLHKNKGISIGIGLNLHQW